LTAELEEMIEEATLDAYGESEQALGFYSMLEENLAVPFQSVMFGVEIVVEHIDMTEDEQIVALCSRGIHRHPIPILDLPLPGTPPEGAKWIDAFRLWKRGR
jgi:hypothetical protein